MFNVNNFIDDICKNTHKKENEVIKGAIGLITEREAITISTIAVHIWHETYCSKDEAVMIAEDLYREGKRYGML